MKKIFFTDAMISIATVLTVIMSITAFPIDTVRHAFAAASGNQTSFMAYF
jgi:hypothetical protein